MELNGMEFNGMDMEWNGIQWKYKPIKILFIWQDTLLDDVLAYILEALRIVKLATDTTWFYHLSFFSVVIFFLVLKGYNDEAGESPSMITHIRAISANNSHQYWIRG